ncbi:MAG: TraR/DksA C4-type zinc finger protein [Myxococcota bacterium]|nr:TraR/DksA C4-type zinc finger protein [Myxococcota bacterium]
MDELSPAQLIALRARLEEQLDGVLDTLDQSKAAAAPVQLDQQSVGRLSRMDAIQQQAMVRANRQRAIVLARQIRTALKRLEDDEYGWCVRCESPIAWARLNAQPETPFCLRCQRGTEGAR